MWGTSPSTTCELRASFMIALGANTSTGRADRTRPTQTSLLVGFAATSAVFSVMTVPPPPGSPDARDEPLRPLHVGGVLGPEPLAHHALLGTITQEEHERERDETARSRHPVREQQRLR